MMDEMTRSEYDNAIELTVTVDRARKFLDGEELDELETALDEAQGDVFSGACQRRFVIIEVR